MRISCSAALLGLLLAATARAADPSPADLEFFEKKIRPLFAEHCLACHSDKKQKGDLRLDSPAAIRKGGETGKLFVPGEPDKSLIIKAVGYKDVGLQMPKRGKLSDELIADLTNWVKRGAPLPADGGAVTVKEFNLEERRKHWSFQPIKKVEPPAVKDKQWVRNPIDAFLLAGLEAKQFAPAAPADKATLLRRVTFDLIGLPPTPAEIDAFLKDDSADAYEKVVERLLASPHYGERWARHWLDLVRYADTSGHEFDFDLPMAYEYRDYVIRALNADLPYDQFVVEHLAGDLLPTPRRHPTEKFNESVIGTGFFWLGESKHSPVDVRAEGAERVDNQLDVFGKTFLGLTLACARCHDHKFDPIRQQDYYALAGFLRSSRYHRAGIDDPEKFAPIVRELQGLNRDLRAEATALSVERLQPQADKFGAYLLACAALNRGQKAGEAAAAFKVDEKMLTAFHGRVGRRGAAPDHILYPWLVLSGKQDGFAARKADLLKALQAPRPADEKVFKDFRLTGLDGWYVTGEAMTADGLDVRVQPQRPLPVTALVPPGVPNSGRLGGKLQGTLRSPTFTIGTKKIWYRVAGVGTKVNLIIDGFQNIRDPIYGGLTRGVNHGEAFQWGNIDVEMWKGHRAYLEFLDEGDGWFAVDQVVFRDKEPALPIPNKAAVDLLGGDKVDSVETLAAAYQALLQAVLEAWRKDKLTGEQALLLDQFFDIGLDELTTGGEDKERRDKLAELIRKRDQANGRVPGPRHVMSLIDGDGENEHIFIRGLHTNLGDEAPRRLPEVFAGKEAPAYKSHSGRLELARKLVDGGNPLLPRVLVNRLWHHHFGGGLVRSVDDFGFQGTPPTQPELLDWLAGEFMRRKWSLKDMHRLMVLSSAYRMGSKGQAKADEADPENRLWHKMPLRRLEAEAIRDAMLAVSGRLERTMYGPGVMPHLTPHMQGRGRPGASGPLDGNGRRSIYINVRRNFLTPLFLAFDYPIPFTTMGRRSVSNVPAQALALLNNPFVKEQADLWAKRALAEKGLTTAQRIDRLYLSAFGRPPSDGERADAQEFIEEQTKASGKADEGKAWADLCHVLFNVKEFIFLE